MLISEMSKLELCQEVCRLDRKKNRHPKTAPENEYNDLLESRISRFQAEYQKRLFEAGDDV